MAIYTPRGLKIRISVPYAFGLIARLFPNSNAFDVLKTTEGIEEFPSCATFLAAMVSFVIQLDPIQIALVVGITYIISNLLNTFGIFIIPGQVTVGTFYSWVSGYGVLLILIVVVGYIMTGWQGVVAYFIGNFIAWCLIKPVEFMNSKRYYKLTGHPFTTSEINFFNAYRIHAGKHGITTNINISEKEMEEDHWQATFEDLACQWPEIVDRFAID